MKVLYLSALPEKAFNELLKKGNILSQAAQKFNKLYIKGFCLNNCDVDVLFFHNTISESDEEKYNNQKIRFLTCKSDGNKIRRNFARVQYINKVVKNYKQEEPNGIVVVDALMPYAKSLVKRAKKFKLNTVSIVTDLPDDISKLKTLKQRLRNCLARKIFYGQFKHIDYLIFLSNGMSDKIQHKKAVVFNGICDFELKNITETAQKFDKKIIVYTGEIRQMYGVHNLVEAFLSLKRDDAELWLYGNGIDFYPELKEKIEQNENVKYMGIKPNDEIVEIQKKATLVVNPRLTIGCGDYIKYSFPSKNIEYMVSGTPLITTRLPAITEEYNDKLFFFDDESVAGMAETLNRCLNTSQDELQQKGQSTKDFVLNKLNNKTIAKEILTFFE